MSNRQTPKHPNTPISQAFLKTLRRKHLRVYKLDLSKPTKPFSASMA